MIDTRENKNVKILMRVDQLKAILQALQCYIKDIDKAKKKTKATDKRFELNKKKQDTLYLLNTLEAVFVKDLFHELPEQQAAYTKEEELIII
jgi:hypothetical protein